MLPEFTYKIEWNRVNGRWKNYASVIPIDGMPSTHPKVTHQICGEQLSAGDPIPSSGLWSTSGRSTAGGNCQTQPGGQLFYGYNFPSSSSGNTGYAIADALVIYMVMDSSSAVYLVISIDKAQNYNNAGGKRLSMGMSSTGLAGNSPATKLVQADDPGEVQWNSGAGTGSGTWRWATCCTDGAVIGPMPTDGFTLTMSVTEYGIPATNGVRVGSWNAASSSVDFRISDLGVATTAAPYLIKISAFKTVDYCNSFKSCGECTVESICHWCGGTCTPITNTSCPEPFVAQGECCPTCVGITTEDACVLTLGCGWCKSGNNCISGQPNICLLYTSPSPRDRQKSRMPSSA